jgi:hypothetical protein
MVAVVGIIAFAQLGPESSSGATSPAAVRQRATTLDAARASVPLPRSSSDPSPHTVMPPIDASRASRGSPRTVAPGATDDDTWAALARCESSGNPSARSGNGRYSGAFQFSDATWQGLGYEGRAADHPYGVQLEAAKRLQARSGWGQWPRCARRLGLR